jgi:hypothetical protein
MFKAQVFQSFFRLIDCVTNPFSIVSNLFISIFIHMQPFGHTSPCKPFRKHSFKNDITFSYHSPLRSTNKSMPKMFINRMFFSISAVGFPRSKSEINVTESPVNSKYYAFSLIPQSQPSRYCLTTLTLLLLYMYKNCCIALTVP